MQEPNDMGLMGCVVLLNCHKAHDMNISEETSTSALKGILNSKDQDVEKTERFKVLRLFIADYPICNMYIIFKCAQETVAEDPLQVQKVMKQLVEM
jgi:hypothetical protein